MAFQLPNMPNYNVQPPQMPSAMEQYGKMLQLKSLLGQQQMQPLQQQEAQQDIQAKSLQNQQQQLQLQSQQAMVKAWSDPDFLKSFTGTDKAESNGLGFDPDAMTKALVSKGVMPQQALALTGQFVDRSQKMAATAKDVAQTGEANAATAQKGYGVLADRIGGILDAPTAKAPAMLDQLKQDLMQNPKLFPGVPPVDLGHVYNANLEHLPAIASVIGLDAKIADFHKAKAEAAKAEQGVIPANGGLSADAQQYLQKDIALNTDPRIQAGKEQLTRVEAQERQAAMQGDPNVAGKLLANGSLTLNELKTRGTTPQFIEKATLAAQKMNPQYNPADEVIAEQVAKSQTANQFFGSANSLIQKNGTLDQLDALGKKIPQHDMPALNTVDDWQKLARGKGPLAAYAANVLGVADDYGKVMGGGTASDSAREHALKLFSQAASPEQRSQAIDATRNAVQSQRDSRIGNNQFLKRQYGAEVGGSGGQGAALSIKAPNGKMYSFKDQASLNAFKQTAGIQ
jgi:hypothetical protein